jgi:hypothetical protein
MALLLAGIDEAGYGPTLGLLCVASSLFRVETHEAGKAPDLWKLLERGVCREPGRGGRTDAKGRVAVGDSKALKLSNSVKSTHPLVHLERAVLTFGRLLQREIATDSDLFGVLGCTLENRSLHHACYSTSRHALPLGQTAGELAITAGLVESTMAKAGVKLESLRVKTIGERDFNGIIHETHNKGETVIFGVGSHLKHLWEHHASGGEEAKLGVVCDRLGGRASYAAMLEREVPGCRVETIEETEVRSRYVLTGRGAGGESRRMGIAFLTESEAANLPVSLASMAAKYVRELSMMRFNAHWNGLFRQLNAKEIAPTAGYATDARRWLDEIGEDVLGAKDRRELIRIA